LQGLKLSLIHTNQYQNHAAQHFQGPKLRLTNIDQLVKVISRSPFSSSAMPYLPTGGELMLMVSFRFFLLLVSSSSSADWAQLAQMISFLLHETRSLKIKAKKVVINLVRVVGGYI